MSMLLRSSILLLFCLLHASVLCAQEKAKLTAHPFFKQLIGTWKAEGELKSEANNNSVKVTEEWTAKLTDEGEILIEGTRVFNDGELQKFRWTFAHNPTTDLLEVVQLNPDDAGNAIHFEGTLTGEPPVLELRAQFGNGGGSATVKDSFKDESHDVLESKVTLLNDAGGINLEGTITHKRVK